MVMLGTSRADSADLTPTPGFIAAALEDQVYAYGGSLDVSFSYSPGIQSTIERPSRYIKTASIAYAERRYENGMVCQQSYDRMACEYHFLALWPSGKTEGAVASWVDGMLTEQALPDPVDFPLWGENLLDLIRRGTVLQDPEPVAGSMCWRVSLPPSGFESLTVRVDPMIGFCPRRIEVKRKNVPTVKPIEFRDYREIAPGVWYPMELRSRVINRRGEEVEVASTVTSVRIRQVFSPSDLIVAFAPRTNVTDADTFGSVQPDQPFVVTRQGVDFGSLRVDESRTKRLAVRDEAFRGLQITGVDCSSEFVSAELDYHQSESKCDPSYYIASLMIRPRPSPAEWRASGGELAGTVTLHTSLPEAPQIEIPFRAEVRGDLKAEPRTVFFGTLAPTQCKRMTVRIVSETGRAFRVTGGTSSSSLVAVSTAPAEAASSATSLVVTAVSTEKPERLEGTTTVQTDDAYQPTLTIPFYGMVSG